MARQLVRALAGQHPESTPAGDPVAATAVAEAADTSTARVRGGEPTTVAEARALAARDRAAAGPTAPPDGLYFTEAWY